MTTVFISYSHDSDQHRDAVLALSERLRLDGVTTILDRYINGSPRQGWPRWMLDSLDEANFVLVVCTESYYRRFRGHEEPGKGKGVDWEGALITQEMHNLRSTTLKFVPIFVTGTEENRSSPNPRQITTRHPAPLRSCAVKLEEAPSTSFLRISLRCQLMHVQNTVTEHDSPRGQSAGATAMP